MRLNPLVVEDDKEMKFEEYYQNLLTHMGIFQNLIENNYFKSFHS